MVTVAPSLFSKKVVMKTPSGSGSLKLEVSYCRHVVTIQIILWKLVSPGCREEWKNLSTQSIWGFPCGISGKEPACQCRDVRDVGSTPGLRRILEEGMAIHFSTLAWRIPMGKGARWATVNGVAKKLTWLKWQHVQCSQTLECDTWHRYLNEVQ